MKIRIIHSILLIGISTLKGFAFPGWTGSTVNFPVSSLPDSYNERYALLTDRNMYSVGEKILFSAFNTSPPAIRDACWSRVIYVHLLKTDGTSVAQDKFPLACSGASGFLYVPDDILTGNYYLCAYTKWMLNVYNLTGRRNAYSIFFKTEGNNIKGYKLSIFGRPIVTLLWNFKFGNYASD